MAEKLRAQALKLLDRIGGVEAHASRAATFGLVGGCNGGCGFEPEGCRGRLCGRCGGEHFNRRGWRWRNWKLCRDELSGGVCGIDDGGRLRSYPGEQWTKQRVMGAAENQDVSILKAVGECFREIDAGDLLGDRMLDPTFLHEWNQKRASFLTGTDAARLKRMAVGLAGDGGLGADDHNFSGAALVSGDVRLRVR